MERHLKILHKYVHIVVINSNTSFLPNSLWVSPSQSFWKAESAVHWLRLRKLLKYSLALLVSRTPRIVKRQSTWNWVHDYACSLTDLRVTKSSIFSLGSGSLTLGQPTKKPSPPTSCRGTAIPAFRKRWQKRTPWHQWRRQNPIP